MGIIQSRIQDQGQIQDQNQIQDLSQTQDQSQIHDQSQTQDKNQTQDLRQILTEYHRIIRRTTAKDASHWEEVWTGLSDNAVGRLTLQDPIFSENAEYVYNLNLLDDENCLKVIVYAALDKHWTALRNYDVKLWLDDILLFRQNLEVIGQYLADIASDGSGLLKEGASNRGAYMAIVRTVTLYFYTRVPEFSDIKIGFFFYLTPEDGVTRFADFSDGWLHDLFRDLKDSKVIRRSYRRLRRKFRDVVDLADRDNVFEHVCQYTYFLNLPSRLSSLACVGDYIAINSSRWTYSLRDRAVVLVTILYQLAHLSRRLGKSPSAYIEITPKEEVRMIADNEAQPVVEGEIGAYFESIIFGAPLNKMYENTGEYLLDRENWDKDLETFQKEFNDRQICSELAGRPCLIAGNGESRTDYSERGHWNYRGMVNTGN